MSEEDRGSNESVDEVQQDDQGEQMYDDEADERIIEEMKKTV